MIFAAGLGTRLQPFTNDKPKALVEFRGRTFLENSIRYLKKYGVDELIINVHHFADLVIEYLKKKQDFGMTIHVSDERNMLLDTGGGLKEIAHHFAANEDFLVYNVDVLTDVCLLKIIDLHSKSKALATLAVRDRKTSRYLLVNPNHELVGWTNIKTGEVKMSRPDSEKVLPFAFSGVHVINSSIFEMIEEDGKFSIIDLYLRLAKQHRIMTFDHSDGRWFDLGKPENIQQAEKEFPIS